MTNRQGAGPWLGVGASACALASLVCGVFVPVNDDDVYQLHAAWLMGQGAVPFREFFEIHPPGLWVLVAPFSLLFSEPSTYVVAARAGTAVLFGLMVWLAGRTIRVTRVGAVVLAVLCLGIMMRTELWIFRTENFSTSLLLLHLWLVAGGDDRQPHPVRDTIAAAALALGGTMSVRVLPFIAIQPGLILRSLMTGDTDLRSAGRAVAAWMGGLAIGLMPAVAYIAAHGLWADTWFWAFRFTSSPEVAVWQLHLGETQLLVFGLGATAAVLLYLTPYLSSRRRAALMLAWVLACLFQVANPIRVRLAEMSLLFTTSMLIAAVVPLVAARGAGLRRYAALITVGVAVLSFGGWVYRPDVRFDRAAYAMQLRVLDWLHDVAEAEPVVLVAPHHPMMARDATDLFNAWQYAFWTRTKAVRGRLRGFADVVRDRAPPVVAHDPWLVHTSGRDLVAWLTATQVMGAEDAAALRAFLADRYARVEFPALRQWPFGHEFWVRRDRLDAISPPQPAVVHAGASAGS